MNVELLKRVKRRILRYPEKFRMDRWNCGTAQCIAGTAVVLTGHKWRAKRPGDDEVFLVAITAVPDAARRELMLDRIASDRLFYVEYWPHEFSKMYRNARLRKQRAKIAAARIDHFIATGE